MPGTFIWKTFSLDRLRSNLNRFIPKSAEPDLSEKRRLGREHFIPVRPCELVEELLRRSELTKSDQESFRSLFQRIESVFHHEYRDRLRRLQDTYSFVNPDIDTEPLTPVRTSAIEREVATDVLFQQFVDLLERANFRQLSINELKGAIGNASALGVRLDVDLTQFDQLAVFARGEIEVSLPRREWRRWSFREVQHDIPMYQRLVVIFRLRPTDGDSEPVKAAYIRLFKNVPQQDIDMALPGGKVRMSVFDQGKILVPTISGVGLAVFKLGFLLFAGIYGLLKIIGLIGGAIGSGWKSVNGYWKTKNKYELSLTRNLYYQNLDNNAGVLLRLTVEAERQELRETLLSYFVLLTLGRPCSTDELRFLAEQRLADCGLTVDFEVSDAIAKLQRLELCVTDNGNEWLAVPLHSAMKNIIERNLHDALQVSVRR